MHKTRIAIEQLIATRLLTTLIEAGYLISIDDGEEIVLKDCNRVDMALKAMFSTDYDTIIVHKDKTPGAVFTNPQKKYHNTAWIKLVYGNSGDDVIHDYDTRIEELVKPAMDLSNIISDGGFTITVTTDKTAWNK